MDRISLGNQEFEGNNNAYVLPDGDSLALVDTGIATEATGTELRRGLEDRGYDFADIDSVVLTHWHPDHAALAGEIRRESGATVYVHEADAPLVRQDPDALAAFDRLRRECFERWGMPADRQEELVALFASSDESTGEPTEVETIADGDRLHVGGTTVDALHAPGHTAGLCCFEIEDGREAFVGDAILPVYTPNVGGADVRVERPLERYLGTLRTIVERGYDRVWPGHRDPIEDPTDRALTILEHHRERTGRVVEVLSEVGPADAWTVSARLFGDLEGIHVVHGPGEAYAHLDHLHHAGVLAVEEGTYRLVDDVDLEAVVPSPET